MFWNFCLQSNMLFPTFVPLVVPSNSNTLDATNSGVFQLPPLPQPKKNKGPLLNLTEKDLVKAGYENSKKPWAEEEDEKLTQLRDQKHLDWPQISKQLPGRNPKMCYNRYRRLENHTKELWKRHQNEKLCSLVEELGEDWKQISKHFEKRTHKQVKEHYINYLRPEIKKDDWTMEEDLKLVNFLNQYGKNWKFLEKNFEGRTQNQIKNRYFGRLKKLSEKKVSKGKQQSDMEDHS